MDRSDDNQTTHDIPEDTSLGSLLRKAREERQIELDEAATATRIRRQSLEALENEDWSKLPTDVFIKGFLRSYAGFLGLNKEMVLNYYLKVSPSQKQKPLPLEEISLQPRRWNVLILILVLALGLIASILYLRGRDISIVDKAFQYLVTQGRMEEKEYTVDQEAVTMKEGAVPADEKGAEEQATALMLEPSGEAEALEESAGLEEIREPEVDGQTGLKPEPDTEPETSAGLIPEPDTEPETSADLIPEPGIEPETPAMGRQTREEQPPSSRYTLDARVNGRTWIAIYIDDGPVREYLFQPGETMKWTADKAFDILVGNAGGIEFFLNGRDVGPLGPEGKVVRLRLPEAMEE